MAEFCLERDNLINQLCLAPKGHDEGKHHWIGEGWLANSEIKLDLEAHLMGFPPTSEVSIYQRTLAGGAFK